MIHGRREAPPSGLVRQAAPVPSGQREMGVIPLGWSLGLPITFHSRSLSCLATPAHGVQVDPTGPTIVFLTVCTKDRKPWLALRGEPPLLLVRSGAVAQAWRVGRYVLMPDHIHLFAAPGIPSTYHSRTGCDTGNPSSESVVPILNVCGRRTTGIPDCATETRTTRNGNTSGTTPCGPDWSRIPRIGRFKEN